MSIGEIVMRPQPDDDPFESEPDEPIGDVPDDEFGSRVRFSRLKLMAQSPLHYSAHPQGESASKEKGTAAHLVLLKGKQLAPWTKKNKAGKTAPRTGDDFRAFAASNVGKVVVLPSVYDPAMRMVDSVRASKIAMEALAGVHEETILFEMLGLECRSTPDARAPGHFAELKTCRSSAPWRFSWQAKTMSYHAQMAFHAEAIRRNKLGDGKTGYIVAVESSAPYPVTVFKLTERAIDKGERQIRFWMESLKGCLASNQWPPYAQSVVDLDMPDDDESMAGALTADDLDKVF